MLRLLSLLFACFVLWASAAEGADRRPNVLFIAVDDLRPELNCYGQAHIHSPNIDRLAAQGTVFQRAYCMVPTCGASRASLMTGIRPARERFVNYLTWAEKDAPGITTLNTHFKNAGYTTLSNGKIFHHPADNAEGWSQPAWRPKGVPTYQLQASIEAEKANTQGRGRGPAFESADVPDDAYADGHVAKKAVDDLRPELACYGQAHIHSPNIDRLAAQGTIFQRAYCMVPTCGASRASLMTGIRPARERFVNYLTWAEKDAPGITTLNTHFKNAGYTTLSNGKIFHHPADNAQGWSQPAWRPKGVPTYQLPASIEAEKANTQGRGRGPAFESADVPDDAYADGHVAKKAINDLRRLKEEDESFFLAVGFFKPHLPFVAPQKYWDLYDHDEIQLPETYHRPQNAPNQAIHTSGELRSYAGIPAQGPVSDETARNLIHGYYACVSYTDAQIGRVLDELDRLGLAENTIVVLWGDHGWNLGEHTLWCKHSCFETSLHAPLIIKAPGFQGGQKTPALTEFIDIYPTLCDLAGLHKPSHLQGESLVPVMRDPTLPGKAAAISRFRNGDTIRTDDFRYTEYTGKQGKLQAKMLYNHRTDPGEDSNIAGTPEVKAEVKRLLKQLREGMGK